ncbi:MAG: hypothetical protein ABIU06_10210 [Anaerolineales bacterium]
MSEDKALPWQNYPEKFIRYAIKFEDTTDDFERLIGYLLLDVGVETLLKAYVLADSTLKYEKREASAKGMLVKDAIPDSKITTANFDKISFHNLIKTVKLIAGAKVTDEELKNAEHYHGIRNIVYHEGRKTIPSKQDFRDYLALANSLLIELLGVNSTKKDGFSDEEGVLLSEFAKESGYKDFEFKVALATEFLRPEYATRRFEAILNKINELYDEENIRESQERIRNKFNELIGKEIKNFNLIRESMQDVTYLRLLSLLSKIDIDANDVEKYLEYREYSISLMKSKEEISPEYVKMAHDLWDWERKIIEKIDKAIEPYLSD